uniref:C2H2-type domain-containing protein n=1 Tax=Ascaris lumbricoides TaxID=6252 RepID=A0A9J2Q3B6_ASCLU
MLHCVGCGPDAATYANADELEIHIASDHVNYVPYECEKCRFSRFPTEFALHSHYTNDHGVKEFYVKYKVTPETGRKRQMVKDLLQRSLNVSENVVQVRPSKRKRASAIEVVQSTTSLALSPCSSPDSEDETRMCEIDKNIKAEVVKVDCGTDRSCTDKDLGGQHVVVAASGEITLNSNYPNYAGFGEMFPSESNSLFDIGLKGLDAVADISQNFFSAEGSSQGVSSKRRRPPRTCTECGLQVTGQRSSLVYHANSKHLRLPLFYCRPCSKTWTTVTKSDVLKHVKAVHGGDESNIVDYRGQYGDKIREMTDKCFPPKQRGNGNEEEDTESNNTEGGVANVEPEGVVSAEALHWLGNEDTSANPA